MVTLLVNDSNITLKSWESILTENGHPCISIQNSLEALVVLEGVPEITLIIADIDMPELNGLELFREIRKRHEWLGIGFIICSNRKDVDTQQQITSLGCNAFLLKPVSEDQLIKKVHVVLEGTPRVLQDPKITCNRFKLTPESFKEMCTVFNEELAHTIQTMEQDNPAFSPKQRLAAILKIQDSAELIGASRLAKLFNPAKTQTTAERETYCNDNSTQFLREFHVLHNVLTSTLS